MRLKHYAVGGSRHKKRGPHLVDLSFPAVFFLRGFTLPVPIHPVFP